MAIRVYPEIGLTIPINGAFSAKVIKDGSSTKLKFNQAYVIDYYSMGDGGLKAVKIENMDQEQETGGKFYVKLKINSTEFTVDSATFQKSGGGSEEDTYYIPICDTDGNGVKEQYVAENIHWMLLPKPKDKKKAGVLSFDPEGSSSGPGGPGQIKWLQFEEPASDDKPFQLVGGTKEKAKIIDTKKCEEEETDPYA